MKLKILMADQLTDFAIIVIPALVALLVYTLACGARKPRSQSSAQKKERTVNLSQRPIVTIAANNILLDDNYKLNDASRAALELLVKKACVFVFVQVNDREQQSEVEKSVSEQFAGIIDFDSILYCQTSVGRASMARQLETVAHFDFDPEAIHQVSIFHKAVLIAPSYVDCHHATWQAQSFSEFMANQNGDFLELLRQ